MCQNCVSWCVYLSRGYYTGVAYMHATLIRRVRYVYTQDVASQAHTWSSISGMLSSPPPRPLNFFFADTLQAIPNHHQLMPQERCPITVDSKVYWTVTHSRRIANKGSAGAMVAERQAGV